MNNNLSALLGSQSSQSEYSHKEMAKTTIPAKPSPFGKDKYANMDQTSALLSKYSGPSQNDHSFGKVNSNDILKMTQEAMMERQKKRVQSDDDEQDTGPIIKRKTNNEDIAVNFKSTSFQNQPTSNSNSSSQKVSSDRNLQSTALQKTSKLDQKVTQKNSLNAQRDQSNMKTIQNGSSQQINKPPQAQMLQKKPVPTNSQASTNTNKGQTTQNQQAKKLPITKQGNQLQSKQPLSGKPNNQITAQQRTQSSMPQQRTQAVNQSVQSKSGQQKPTGTPQGQVRPQTSVQKPTQNGNLKQGAPSQQSGVKPPVKGITQQRLPPNAGAQNGGKKIMFKDLPLDKQLVQLQLAKKKLESIQKRTPDQNLNLKKIADKIVIFQKKLKQRQTGQQGKPTNQQKGVQAKGVQAKGIQGQKPQSQVNKAPQQTQKEKIDKCQKALAKLKALKSRNPQQEKTKQILENFLQKIKQQNTNKQQEKDSKLNQEQKRKVQEQRERMLKLEQDRRRQKMMMKRNQNTRRRDYEEEDDYDYTDGFIVEDDFELDEENRRELDRITNKAKIRRLAKKYDKEEIRESGMDFIQHEEYKSKIIGRQEDLEEEKKLKKEKIERQKRKGYAVDSDDDVDIDEEDEDDEDEEEENQDEDDEELGESLENFIVDEEGLEGEEDEEE